MRAVVFGYWNEPVSVEMATKRFSAIAAIERQFLALEQLEKNLPGGRRGRIDVDQVAVARIARVMIDVDPDFALRDGFERGRRARFCVAVSSAMATSKSCGSLGGVLEQFAARQETEFFEQPVLVPDRHILAELAAGESASASWLPSASPSGRTWLRTAKRLLRRAGACGDFGEAAS